MQKTLLIAKWEFLSTVTRRAYIFAVIAMPLFFTIVGAIPVLSNRSAAATTAGVPTAIVDPAAIVDLDVAARLAAGRNQRPMLQRYDTLDGALADLQARKVSGVYALSPDYLATGAIAAYGRSSGLLAAAFTGQRQAQVVDAIRASVMHGSLQGELLARAYAPAAHIKRFTVDRTGAIRAADGGPGAFGAFAGPFVVLILFTMSIFFSAGFLQQGTIEDKQNRVIEILLSSVTPEQLLIGKLLGFGAAGLLQVGFYVALVIVPGATMMPLFQVPIGSLLLSLVYFAIGYTLFATLMGGFGMIGRTQQETAQFSAIWTLTAVSPLWFMMAVSAAPNGLLSRALSFFPLTSPVTMIMRLSIGGVPAIDVVVSIAVGAIAIYFALRAAAKIFRAATLMYGKRPTLPELVRWLRAA